MLGHIREQAGWCRSAKLWMESGEPGNRTGRGERAPQMIQRCRDGPQPGSVPTGRGRRRRRPATAARSSATPPAVSAPRRRPTHRPPPRSTTRCAWGRVAPPGRRRRRYRPGSGGPLPRPAVPPCGRVPSPPGKRRSMPSLSVRCRYGPIRPCSVGVVEVTVSLTHPTVLVTASGVR